VTPEQRRQIEDVLDQRLDVRRSSVFVWSKKQSDIDAAIDEIEKILVPFGRGGIIGARADGSAPAILAPGDLSIIKEFAKRLRSQKDIDADPLGAERKARELP